MEEKMRNVSTFASMVALGFGLALAASASALTDGAHPFHKHAIQMHRVAYAGLSSNATALARAFVPAAAVKDSDGLRAISERTESTGFPSALGLRGHPKSSFARMMQLDRSLL
jgi:hypothetical protein